MRRLKTLTLSTALVGVAACAAAVWLAVAPIQEPLSGFAPTRAVPLFPKLQDQRGELASLEIESMRRQLRFERTDAAWRSVTHHGYPANGAAIKALVDDLAALRADYVSDASSQTASGSQRAGDRVTVRLFSSDHGLIAAAVVAHEITVPGDGGGLRLMIRREHEQPEWLARPAFRVAMDDGTWLKRDLLDVPRERVARLVSVSAGGERVIIERSANEGLRVAKGGAGSDLAGNPRLESAAAALEGLEFDEALPVEQIPDATTEGRTIIATANGLSYTIDWLSGDGRRWATLSASAGRSAELAERAQRFNRRHAAWAYRLPLLVQHQLRIRADELRDLQQSSPAVDERG